MGIGGLRSHTKRMKYSNACFNKFRNLLFSSMVQNFLKCDRSNAKTRSIFSVSINVSSLFISISFYSRSIVELKIK